ncbi:MAG: tetratricopeptide repeat protein [Bacteroidota bacterium]
MRFVLLILVFLYALPVSAQYGDRALKAFEQSYVLEKAGDFRKASALLREVYQEDSYEFNLRLGWLYYQAGSFDESKTYYRRALNLLPYSEEARFGLILPLAARGEWNEVITVYNQILANNPGNTIALYRLGLIHYERKEYSQAARFFQKVIDLYPFGYDGMLMMAWTNLRLGKSREAHVLFNKVLLWSPGDPSAQEGLKLLK